MIRSLCKQAVLLSSPAALISKPTTLLGYLLLSPVEVVPLTNPNLVHQVGGLALRDNKIDPVKSFLDINDNNICQHFEHTQRQTGTYPLHLVPFHFALQCAKYDWDNVACHSLSKMVVSHIVVDQEGLSGAYNRDLTPNPPSLISDMRGTTRVVGPYPRIPPSSTNLGHSDRHPSSLSTKFDNRVSTDWGMKLACEARPHSAGFLQVLPAVTRIHGAKPRNGVAQHELPHQAVHLQLQLTRDWGMHLLHGLTSSSAKFSAPTSREQWLRSYCHDSPLLSAFALRIFELFLCGLSDQGSTSRVVVVIEDLFFAQWVHLPFTCIFFLFNTIITLLDSVTWGTLESIH